MNVPSLAPTRVAPAAGPSSLLDLAWRHLVVDSDVFDAACQSPVELELMVPPSAALAKSLPAVARVRLAATCQAARSTLLGPLPPSLRSQQKEYAGALRPPQTMASSPGDVTVRAAGGAGAPAIPATPPPSQAAAMAQRQLMRLARLTAHIDQELRRHGLTERPAPASLGAQGGAAPGALALMRLRQHIDRSAAAWHRWQPWPRLAGDALEQALSCDDAARRAHLQRLTCASSACPVATLAQGLSVMVQVAEQLSTGDQPPRAEAGRPTARTQATDFLRATALGLSERIDSERSLLPGPCDLLMAAAARARAQLIGDRWALLQLNRRAFAAMAQRCQLQRPASWQLTTLVWPPLHDPADVVVLLAPGRVAAEHFVQTTQHLLCAALILAHCHRQGHAHGLLQDIQAACCQRRARLVQLMDSDREAVSSLAHLRGCSQSLQLGAEQVHQVSARHERVMALASRVFPHLQMCRDMESWAGACGDLVGPSQATAEPAR